MEGMNYQAFWKFIKLLHDNDLLQYVEVVGSWCEYLYAQSGFLPGFTASLRTLDVDFLIKNMRRPGKRVNLATIAADNGYTIDHDYLTGTTKIYTPDLMEIEFLIEQKGAGVDPVLETNLGVSAQALHHMHVLKEFSIDLSVFGMDITVPVPEAYVIHKIIINDQRGKKSEKDRQSIERLMPYLSKEKLEEIKASLSKAERKAMDKYFANEMEVFKL